LAFLLLLLLLHTGIGRFLRLTVSNLRLKIFTEDFPSTQRVVAMVQVRGDTAVCFGRTRRSCHAGDAKQVSRKTQVVGMCSTTVVGRSQQHTMPARADIRMQDIYIARAYGELQLEEELFYLLLKIYKTPQLLNQLTRLSTTTPSQ
jgi:Piezo non-specific cation channel, R-Ras-binding domain